MLERKRKKNKNKREEEEDEENRPTKPDPQAQPISQPARCLQSAHKTPDHCLKRELFAAALARCVERARS